MAQKPGYFRANFFDARYWLASGAIGGATGKYYNSRYFLSPYYQAPYWVRSGALAPVPGGAGSPAHLPFFFTVGRMRTYISVSSGVAAATSPAHSLIVSYTPGSDRNDFTGQVGVRIGIGAANIPISWMGYRTHAGNSGTRTVTLYEWFGDTVVATTTIDITGAAAGTFVWKAISPVTLLAGGYYALLSNVTAFDGETWTNPGAVTMAASIVNIYDSYRVPASALATGTVNDSFIGLDLGWD